MNERLVVDETCHDVAVVGGGIGGAYSVWRLRNQGLNVGLYEYCDRLGGRFYTHTFTHAPDVPVELGAMRFSKKDHQLLYRTLQKVGLKTKPFLDRDQVKNDAMYYMRGRYLRKTDFRDNNIPYNLRQHERLGIDNIYRYLIQQTNFSGNASLFAQERRYLVSKDGVKLEHQTIQEFFKKYLSGEAVDILSNTIKYSLYHMSAASVIPQLIFNDTMVGENWLTISGGMQQLPVKLVKQFLSVNTKRHLLYLNHQLLSISRKTEDKYNLMFVRTRTLDGKTMQSNESVIVCSRKVILAVPTTALLKVNWEILQKPPIVSNLNTVNHQFGIKLFLVYDFSWWSDIHSKSDVFCGKLHLHNYRQKCPNPIIQHYHYYHHQVAKFASSWYATPKRTGAVILTSDLPLERTVDFGVSKQTGAAVLMVAYSSHDMWRELQKHGNHMWTQQHGVTTEVVRHAHLYLSQLYNIPVKNIPEPIDGRISQWNEYPYGGAYSTWKIGVHWSQVWKLLHKPSVIDDVFLTSGSYWNYDSDTWSENTLEVIDDIMRSYF
ncbi:achacin-like [Pecten maximus]|uniref:achacin-like n=1 Tax=Pecten maximus TaxID=6579 RepID=UPI001458B95B|nr:achacin-like [Pecten maximus]